jgi:ATP-dependent helicase HrpA
VPGLAAPRIEALLRSLPKEARRNLIPIGATTGEFLAEVAAGEGAASGVAVGVGVGVGVGARAGASVAVGAGNAPVADPQSLRLWLKERRGIPESLIRFDLGAVPAHLLPQLAVTVQGRNIVYAKSLADLRRETAKAARADLDHRARAAYGVIGAWSRFELEELPDEEALALDQGSVRVYPSLWRGASGLEVRYEWSAAEAVRSWRHGAAQLARTLLAGQARDLRKSIAGNAPLLLAASPYAESGDLIEMLLQRTFRRACFEDAPAPRTRDSFNQAVERGRSRLHSCLDEIAAGALAWLTEARSVRRALDDRRTALSAEAVEESHLHLRRLLSPSALESTSTEWLRQLPKYLKAEERRWQRNAARGGEPPNTVRELNAWSARYQALESLVYAELRWIPQLEEMRHWIEEYRVSLYAQELKTLGPVSAARLEARAAEIEAWIAR